jgi:hypothetical protein
VPALPRAITFSRRARYSHRASSQHERLVDAGQRSEVVAVEALRRKTGRPDPPLDQALFPIDHLQLGQAEQIADVVDSLGGALPSYLVVLAHKGRQSECLQMVAK